MKDKKAVNTISAAVVDKRINEASIADSLLILLFVGIMIYQTAVGTVIFTYIYLEALVCLVAVALFFSLRKKLVFTGIIAAVFWAFFGFVVWIAYSLYVSGDANVPGISTLIIIPIYLVYQNTIAFTGLLRLSRMKKDDSKPITG